MKSTEIAAEITKLVQALPTNMPVGEAKELVAELKKTYNATRGKLTEIGLQHELYISLGSEHLLHDADDYNGFEKGDWVSSSYDC